MEPFFTRGSAQNVHLCYDDMLYYKGSRGFYLRHSLRVLCNLTCYVDQLLNKELPSIFREQLQVDDISGNLLRALVRYEELKLNPILRVDQTANYSQALVVDRPLWLANSHRKVLLLVVNLQNLC